MCCFQPNTRPQVQRIITPHSILAFEPEAGIEPATYALRVRCSTTELPGRMFDRSQLYRTGTNPLPSVKSPVKIVKGRQCLDQYYPRRPQD